MPASSMFAISSAGARDVLSVVCCVHISFVLSEIEPTSLELAVSCLSLFEDLKSFSAAVEKTAGVRCD